MNRIASPVLSLLAVGLLLLLASVPVVQSRIGQQEPQQRSDEEEIDGVGSSSSNKHDGLLRRLSEHHRRLLNDDDEVRVIVGYKNDAGKRAVESRMKRRSVDLPSIKAEAISVSVSELLQLADDPNVRYVDVDYDIRGATEATPYGVVKTQNGLDTRQASAPSGSSSGACGRSSSLKVAVIDSGADVGHPDLPCIRSNNCMGRDFTGGRGGSWNNPTNDHGM